MANTEMKLMNKKEIDTFLKSVRRKDSSDLTENRGGYTMGLITKAIGWACFIFTIWALFLSKNAGCLLQ